jgi:preprotein translocase subunit SecE
MIIQGLKPRIFNKLNKFGRKSIQELLSVIWSIRTTLRRSTGFTMSFNVYVTKVVLPHGLGVWVPEA